MSQNILIADKDIIVYKILKANNKQWPSADSLSYTPNTLYESEELTYKCLDIKEYSRDPIKRRLFLLFWIGITERRMVFG